MFNVERKYIINSPKDDFIDIVMDQTELVKSFKFVKNSSIGGKDIRAYLDGSKFHLFPNTVLTDLLGNLQFRINCELVDRSNLLELRIRLSPPVWATVLIFIFLSMIIIFLDFEWYARVGLFIFICLFVFNYNQCINALKNLELIILKNS